MNGESVDRDLFDFPFLSFLQRVEAAELYHPAPEAISISTEQTSTMVTKKGEFQRNDVSRHLLRLGLRG